MLSHWKTLVVGTTLLTILMTLESVRAVGPARGGDEITDGRSDEEKSKREYAKQVRTIAEAIRQVEQHREASEQDQEARVREMTHELQRVRLQEVDLRSVLERMEIDGNEDAAHGLRRELVEVQAQMQRAQIELERAMVAQERDAERRDLMTMTDRLEYVASWRELAFDPPQAILMATQSLVELHLAAGHPEAAGAQLEQLLEKSKNVGARTAIRFALKDIYAEMGRTSEASKHMVQVILENGIENGGLLGDE